MMYSVISFKANKKVLFAFLVFVISASFFSCDPRGIDNLYMGGTFQIKAKVLNSQDSLNLGDSLIVVFEIPDTITLQDGIPYNISATGTEIILTEKISCEPSEEVRIADSTVTGGINVPLANNWCKIYANPGSISGNNVLRLTKVGNKLLATYYLIPTRKGVFYISSGSVGGYFEGNSTSGKIKCRVVFDFDVLNRHHNLLQPAIGVNKTLAPIISEKASHGQGLYVFAVK